MSWGENEAQTGDELAGVDPIVVRLNAESLKTFIYKGPNVGTRPDVNGYQQLFRPLCYLCILLR